MYCEAGLLKNAAIITEKSPPKKEMIEERKPLTPHLTIIIIAKTSAIISRIKETVLKTGT